ncbi:MAG TPA: hypothetical protein VHY19_07555 [Steroidobacteraceae bacterium]|nr:hypothetical protein [Steroidobacteraceae bacterium]
MDESSEDASALADCAVAASAATPWQPSRNEISTSVAGRKRTVQRGNGRLLFACTLLQITAWPRWSPDGGDLLCPSGMPK